MIFYYENTAAYEGSPVRATGIKHLTVLKFIRAGASGPSGLQIYYLPFESNISQVRKGCLRPLLNAVDQTFEAKLLKGLWKFPGVLDITKARPGK